MISEPISARALPASQSVPVRSLSDVKQVLSESGTDWIVIAPASEVDREIASTEQMLEKYDVIWSGSDPLIKWFWTHTTPPLAACLGVTAPILIRTALWETVSFREDLPIDLSILLSLARTKARFGAEPGNFEQESSAGDLHAHSPIPEQESSVPDSLRKELLKLSVSELISSETSPVDARAVKAGLLLIHDLLEASHSISQSIEGEGIHRNGDYWHAIMHRREPDFGNSKYWFRRVRVHPIYPELASAAIVYAQRFQSAEINSWVKRLTAQEWDSFAFVDFCQEMHSPNCRGTALHQFAEQVQMLEMLLLLRQSWRDANSTGN